MNEDKMLEKIKNSASRAVPPKSLEPECVKAKLEELESIGCADARDGRIYPAEHPARRVLHGNIYKWGSLAAAFCLVIVCAVMAGRVSVQKKGMADMDGGNTNEYAVTMEEAAPESAAEPYTEDAAQDAKAAAESDATAGAAGGAQSLDGGADLPDDMVNIGGTSLYMQNNGFTVQIFREEDGSMVWQGEMNPQADHMAFAEAGGTIREVHPADGQILLIGEYRKADAEDDGHTGEITVVYAYSLTDYTMQRQAEYEGAYSSSTLADEYLLLVTTDGRTEKPHRLTVLDRDLNPAGEMQY